MTDLPELILVPVDGSPSASAAAAYAARLAEKLGAGVRLLYAFPETPVDMFGLPRESYRPEDLKYFTPEGFDKLREDSSRAAFEPARKAIGKTTAKVEEKVITGSTGKAILDHAAGVRGAMIIMGRRGLSHFTEVLMGSTTQRVLHHAKCPVMVIR